MSAAAARVANLSINSLRRRRVHLPRIDFDGRSRFQATKRTSGSSRPKSLVQGIAKHANAAIATNGAKTSLLMQSGRLPLRNGTNTTRGHYAATAELPLFDISSSQYLHSDETSYPQPARNKEGKDFASDLIVVLDMDECLIHSQFLNLSSNDYRQFEADRPPSEVFSHDDEAQSVITSSCESFRLSLPDGDLVHVNKRPNLDVFLRQICERYETYVFTAAMEVYASPLLDTLDPDGTMFQKRLYREHCTFDESIGVYVKDLKKAMEVESDSSVPSLAFNDRRIVLVDNNPYSFLANPSNGILVSNFYDDPKDDTLDAVMELLHDLETVEDVRPFLDSKFGLKDALKEIVDNTSWR